MPIPEILSRTDKVEVTKQLGFFEGGQNKEFEDKVQLIGLSKDFIEFLEFSFNLVFVKNFQFT